MNVALIGNGYWGKIYLKTLEKIPNINVNVYTHNYKDLFLTDAQCVIIATPAETHFQIAKDCLNAKKHILVEKPFVMNSTQINELKKIADDNLIIMVGHIYLHHDGIKKLEELLRTEKDNIQFVYSKRMSNNKNNNSLFEMGSHDIYILNYLFNDYIAEEKNIFGDLSHCIFNIQYKKENIINAYTEVSNYLYKSNKIREIIFEGINKRIIFDDTVEENIKIFDKKTQEIKYYKIHQNITPLEKQCCHFFECIKNKSKPMSGIDDAFDNIRSLEILQKMI